MHSPRNLSKPDLVTLAVYDLGGTSAPVDTEDIAIRAHELAPGTFAWRKYPDRINLELVRVALVDASRAKTGGYVAGSGKRGWSLTKAGAEWSRRVGDRLLGDGTGDLRIHTHTPEPWHVVSERARIRSLDAWARWNAGALVDAAEAMRVFRIDQYTPMADRRAKVGRLSSLFSGEDEMAPFINEMSDLALGGAESTSRRAGDGKRP